MNPNRKTLALLTVGILLGIAIWVFSPWLTGKVEPWDADAPIWSLSWLIVAIAGGLVGHIRGVWLPIGYGFGQMLVTIQSVFKGEFGTFGWAFIGGYAAVAALIALALTGIVRLLKYYWHTNRPPANGA